MDRLIKGVLHLGEGPTWTLDGAIVASTALSLAEVRPSEILLEVGDALWTIKRRLNSSRRKPTKRVRLKELSARGYELNIDETGPAVWTEPLSSGAGRIALKEHLGVGVMPIEQWRSAGATARASMIMMDFLTRDDRFELRPRLEGLADPKVSVAALSGATAGGPTRNVAQLLWTGQTVALGDYLQFNVLRMVPLSVALLVSYVINQQRPAASAT